jgi:hypothetical protein
MLVAVLVFLAVAILAFTAILVRAAIANHARLPAVFVAALIVKSTPLEPLRWLVFIVVIYAAAVMARAAWLERSAHELDGAGSRLRDHANGLGIDRRKMMSGDDQPEIRAGLLCRDPAG